jgi:hypothetical protein
MVDRVAYRKIPYYNNEFRTVEDRKVIINCSVEGDE